MRQPQVDDVVRLLAEIPELDLREGEIGVVRSTWFAPDSAYEVEFQATGHLARALLQAEQLELEEESSLVEAVSDN